MTNMPDPALGTEQGQVRVLPSVLAPETTPQRRIFPAGHLARLEHCWAKGENAREVGFERVSPYYENVEADLYWFAGFDGVSFDAALRLYTAADLPHRDTNQ